MKTVDEQFKEKSNNHSFSGSPLQNSIHNRFYSGNNPFDSFYSYLFFPTGKPETGEPPAQQAEV